MNELEGKKRQTAFSWAANMWKTQLLFSTAIALLVMIVLQTLALGFEFDTVGLWFGTWLQNWINILRNNAGIGIVALGMTFVIISGGIDLAVGSTLVMVGAFVMMLIDSGPKGLLLNLGISGVPAYVIAILLGMALGALLGSFTGLLITRWETAAFYCHPGHHENFPQCHPAFHAGLYSRGSQEFPKNRQHGNRRAVGDADHLLGYPGGAVPHCFHTHHLLDARSSRSAPMNAPPNFPASVSIA